MAIFNSYVKLPEGKSLDHQGSICSWSIPHDASGLRSRRKGTHPAAGAKGEPTSTGIESFENSTEVSTPSSGKNHDILETLLRDTESQDNLDGLGSMFGYSDIFGLRSLSHGTAGWQPPWWAPARGSSRMPGRDVAWVLIRSRSKSILMDRWQI